MALCAATEVKPIIPRREYRMLLEYYLLVKKNGINMLPRQTCALTAKARKLEFQVVISKLLGKLCVPEGCYEEKYSSIIKSDYGRSQRTQRINDWEEMGINVRTDLDLNGNVKYNGWWEKSYLAFCFRCSTAIIQLYFHIIQ